MYSLSAWVLTIFEARTGLVLHVIGWSALFFLRTAKIARFFITVSERETRRKGKSRLKSVPDSLRSTLWYYGVACDQDHCLQLWVDLL